MNSRWIAGVGLAMALLGVNEARGESEDRGSEKRAEAEDAFKRGVTAFKDNRFEQAKSEFQEAQSLSPHPQILFNLAITHERLGDDLEAAMMLDGIIADSGRETTLGARANERLDSLAAKLARVELTIENKGTEIELDGEVQDLQSFFVEPGAHVVIVRAGDVSSTWRLNLSAGEERVIEWEPGTQESKLVIKKQERRPVISVDDDENDDNDDIDEGANWSFGAVLGGVVDAKRVVDTASPLVGVSANNKMVHLGIDAIFTSEFSTTVIRPSVRITFVPRVEGELSGTFAFGDQSFWAGAAGLRVNAPLSDALRIELAAQVSYATRDFGLTVPVLFGLRYSK